MNMPTAVLMTVLLQFGGVRVLQAQNAPTPVLPVTAEVTVGATNYYFDSGGHYPLMAGGLGIGVSRILSLHGEVTRTWTRQGVGCVGVMSCPNDVAYPRWYNHYTVRAQLPRPGVRPYVALGTGVLFSCEARVERCRSDVLEAGGALLVRDKLDLGLSLRHQRDHLSCCTRGVESLRLRLAYRLDHGQH